MPVQTWFWCFHGLTHIALTPLCRLIVSDGQEEDTTWGRLRNDLEPAVFPKYLLLPVIKDWLKKQSETLFALMSGSGSTLFAIVRNQPDGETLRSTFPARIRRADMDGGVPAQPCQRKKA